LGLKFSVKTNVYGAHFFPLCVNFAFSPENDGNIVCNRPVRQPTGFIAQVQYLPFSGSVKSALKKLRRHIYFLYMTDAAFKTFYSNVIFCQPMLFQDLGFCAISAGNRLVRQAAGSLNKPIDSLNGLSQDGV
jgi:hypothetical protein